MRFTMPRTNANLMIKPNKDWSNFQVEFPDGSTKTVDELTKTEAQYFLVQHMKASLAAMNKAHALLDTFQKIGYITSRES